MKHGETGISPQSAEWCGHAMSEAQKRMCERVWGGEEDLAVHFELAYERKFGKSAWYWREMEGKRRGSSLKGRPHEFLTEGYTADFEDWGQKIVVEAVVDRGMDNVDAIYGYILKSLYV